MEEKMKKNEEGLSVDFYRLMTALLSKAWLITLVSLLSAAIMLVGSFFLITPKYKSSAMFYVNNNNVSLGDASFSISSSDLAVSRNLVDSYIVILNTRETINDVIDYAGVNRTYSQIKGMISAQAVNETEIFQVVVNSEDPAEAQKIADSIAYILPKRIGSIMDGTSAKVVDAAVIPASPSSPNYTVNTLIGFLLGFVAIVGVLAMREIFDVTILSEDDVGLVCNRPILASVPDMTAHSKGGSYYNSAKKKKKKNVGAYEAAAKHAFKKPGVMGRDVSFAASEAYKLLRTKLQFSFADDNACHVIGLSSSLSGEGKSLTAINLAYSLSQLDKKVILIDCDMRRPTLAEKLGILKKPGLSSYLTGQCHLDILVQPCSLKGDEQAFNVISAGQNPPNPVELLSSAKMERMLTQLRQKYDYVVLDLPPVGEVTDAMAVAKKVDGMLLVVRQNYCDRIALADTVRQFDFIESKILGLVFNCIAEAGGTYSKGYYKRYYKYSRYGYRYGYRYANRYGEGNAYANNDRTVAAPKKNKGLDMKNHLPQKKKKS